MPALLSHAPTQSQEDGDIPGIPSLFGLGSSTSHGLGSLISGCESTWLFCLSGHGSREGGYCGCARAGLKRLMCDLSFFVQTELQDVPGFAVLNVSSEMPQLSPVSP